ncbi:thiaminase/transcriptional activator TenA [Methylobacterium sp. PvP062]|uniref:Aminopyrimidine aminohydrolase n=2 Tax=Methylobacterium radiotolerans TaxID=31998 RepID=B1LSR8_METRJ|nr:MULTISPECIES: thiaminase II [Methylobacterium]MCX7334327.1 thiaminase II [Hyphomicrobiales bacterium]GAN46717.1 TenA family transcriptional regulator [Methylobacterium sp. ME121]ACB25370.1 transcriptional activator, TenA family [Methylobacterium radiotolerans JCM 2831]MBP2496376.1 thiaminase/transcriptional activator TenA [Methylobacterium sp. PvP105]MBP2503753.1 thiaminase/transcriptional activator TenA [Methylobacterium sp. PvP109]
MASPGLAGALGAFSQEAWARNAAAYETIRSMPFNAELAAGTLPQDRFRHYIVQDAHYLIGFGRALSLAAAKAPDPDTIVQFSRAAQEAIVVERALHGGFFRDYGIGPETFAATPLTPACDHYVCYLVATAYAEPYAVLCAALLPCFWIYKAVGDDIFARAAPDNPYRAWIDTYAGDEFAAAVAAMIAATDRAALDASEGERARMHRAFTQATRLEWQFWDSAYRDAAWTL